MIDADTLVGITSWAEAQPLPEEHGRSLRVTRWHGFIGVGGGYSFPLKHDVLGLQAAGIAGEDPGFDGVAGRLEGGLAWGPWAFGLAVPFIHVRGATVATDGGEIPVAGPTLLLGAEAQVRFTLPVGRIVGLGAQVSGGASLLRTAAAIDTNRVAHRLDAYLVPSGEAAVVVTQRLGGHWRLEQQVGVRAYSAVFLNGILSTVTLQVGLRHVF